MMTQKKFTRVRFAPRVRKDRVEKIWVAWGKLKDIFPCYSPKNVCTLKNPNILSRILEKF
jgi:hypothetical protein